MLRCPATKNTYYKTANLKLKIKKEGGGGIERERISYELF
jgi:hypothetical protein